MWIRLKRKRERDQFKKDLETFLREHPEEPEEEIELFDRLTEAKEAWEKSGKPGLEEYLKKITEEPPLPADIKRRG